MNKFAAIIAIALVSLAVAPAANARGFLSGIVDAVIPGSGEVLDNAHDQIGAPLNQVWNEALVAGAETVIPGSGPFVGAIRDGQAGGGFPQGPQAPQGQRFAQQPMGSFCYTQAGRFGPGPINPLGAPCTANTQWGMIPGQVGQ